MSLPRPVKPSTSLLKSVREALFFPSLSPLICLVASFDLIIMVSFIDVLNCYIICACCNVILKTICYKSTCFHFIIEGNCHPTIGDENKKTLLDLRVQDHLLRLIQHEDRIVRRNSCMALGVLAGHRKSKIYYFSD